MASMNLGRLAFGPVQSPAKGTRSPKAWSVINLSQLVGLFVFAHELALQLAGCYHHAYMPCELPGSVATSALDDKLLLSKTKICKIPVRSNNSVDKVQAHPVRTIHKGIQSFVMFQPRSSHAQGLSEHINVEIR